MTCQKHGVFQSDSYRGVEGSQIRKSGIIAILLERDGMRRVRHLHEVACATAYAITVYIISNTHERIYA
jgi:hypothetical protein